MLINVKIGIQNSELLKFIYAQNKTVFSMEISWFPITL